MRMEGTGNLFGYEGLMISYGEEKLGEVDVVCEEVIRVVADSPPLDSQREGDGTFSG